MPKFAANLTMLFNDKPFLERFAAARSAGFDVVEYLFPYEFPAETLKAQLSANGLEQVLFNLPCGNWSGGDRGIAAAPDRVGEFRTGVGKAIGYAEVLGVSRLNCLAGKRVPGFSDEDHWNTLAANVRFAAEALQGSNMLLLVEAINHYDIPGFFLNRTGQVARLTEEVNLPNVRIQYDIYHAQREEGELAATLRKYLNLIGHIQIADNPGRHQPGTGEINYPFLFAEMDRLGYSGVIGLEYVPEPDTVKSLAWVKDFGYRL
jgi:hydroxypyruvate isomerase